MKKKIYIGLVWFLCLMAYQLFLGWFSTETPKWKYVHQMETRNTSTLLQEYYKETHLAPYLFIICLDYVLRTSIDKIRENGFELTKRRSKRYPAKTITDADYADDLAILANTPNQAETLLHSLERAAAGIGPPCQCKQNWIYVVTTKRATLPH